jgi:hypothetical protein
MVNLIGTKGPMADVTASRGWVTALRLAHLRFEVGEVAVSGIRYEKG